MELLIAIVLFLIVAAFISAPLRKRPQTPGPEEVEEREREAALADLEARKEAKYREIRDTELDKASGKLNEEDFRRQDAELRREAVEILERIDSLRKPGGSASP
jgi:hypothetical protein